MTGAMLAGRGTSMAQVADTVVPTAAGQVRGVSGAGVTAFHAIPYAAPPVGPLRFAAPTDPFPWQGIRDCSKVGVSAPQGPSRLDAVMGTVSFVQDEDCLTLSVWTPSPDGGRRPVFMWIHGGAYLTGGGDLPFYSGAMLARAGDVVVVNINYRLGALGYLYFPEIDAAPANRGLLDQARALQWVYDNIAAFGGDPENITVGGQSAGGTSTLALLGIAESRKLIRRAIVQSPAVKTLSMEQAREVTERFLKAAAVPDGNLTKLRALPVSAILEAQRNVQAQIAASGNLNPPLQIVAPSIGAPIAPADAVASGVASSIPLLIGTARDEVHAWLAQDENMLRGTDWDMVEKLYKLAGVRAPLAYGYAKWKAGDKRPWQVVSAMLTEAGFRKPVATIADSHVKHGGEAYVYRFDWRPTPTAIFGACHCIELPFVFDNLADWPNAPMLEGLDRSSFGPLAAMVQGAWLSFIRSGNPTSAGLPAWPHRNPTHPQIYVLDEDVRIATDAT